MKGAHGFISVTEWPLMIVSTFSDYILMYSEDNCVNWFLIFQDQHESSLKNRALIVTQLTNH